MFKDVARRRIGDRDLETDRGRRGFILARDREEAFGEQRAFGLPVPTHFEKLKAGTGREPGRRLGRGLARFGWLFNRALRVRTPPPPCLRRRRGRMRGGEIGQPIGDIRRNGAVARDPAPDQPVIAIEHLSEGSLRPMQQVEAPSELCGGQCGLSWLMSALRGTKG